MGYFKRRREQKEAVRQQEISAQVDVLEQKEADRQQDITDRVDVGVFKGLEKVKNQMGYYHGNNRVYGGGGEKWAYGVAGSGSGIMLNHTTARLNGRAAYQETPQAKALVDRFADTIADTGLRLECAPRASILGISEVQAEKWASNVEARFDLFARSKLQHRSETMTWYQSHRLYQIFQHRDNDIFTRLFYSKDKSVLNPLQFEFIDPSQIRGDTISSTWGIQNYDDGIKRDARGREIGYKIWVQSKDNTQGFNMVDVPRIGAKSGRVFMLHGFSPVFAGQGRGFSRLAHLIQDFQNITDFSLAQIKKAINQSNITMYVKPSEDAPATNPLDSILTNKGAGPAAVQFGSDPTPAADAQLNAAPVNFHSLPEATMDIPGSTGVFGLNAGEDLKPFDGKAPAESYDKFVDAFCSYMVASSGMPLEVMLMKFGSSYSASRAALVLFWRIANIWREEMAADYLNPCFEMWMSGEIAARRIAAPGWLDPVLKAAWLNSRWIGSPMPNIDPMRTAKADQIYTGLGAQDLDRVAINLNGSDDSANRAKLTRQYQELPDPPWQPPKAL